MNTVAACNTPLTSRPPGFLPSGAAERPKKVGTHVREKDTEKPHSATNERRKRVETGEPKLLSEPPFFEFHSSPRPSWLVPHAPELERQTAAAAAVCRNSCALGAWIRERVIKWSA